MINSSHALVFAMLSTASGWGLPSHDSLHSPNESGVDGPRDRRQLQGSGSSCDYGWSALPAPRALPLLPNVAAAFLPAATHKPPLPPVTRRVTPAVIRGVTTVATGEVSSVATTVATAAAIPAATPVVTPVAFSPAAIMAATRAPVSPVLLTIPAPQRTSLVWPIMPRLASWPAKTDRHACAPPPHTPPLACARRRNPTPHFFVHQ